MARMLSTRVLAARLNSNVLPTKSSSLGRTMGQCRLSTIMRADENSDSTIADTKNTPVGTLNTGI